MATHRGELRGQVPAGHCECDHRQGPAPIHRRPQYPAAQGVARVFNSRHQLLYTPDICCPTFASRTMQGVAIGNGLTRPREMTLSVPDSYYAVGLPEPGGCTAFRSHSNSNMLIHPARGQIGLLDAAQRDHAAALAADCVVRRPALASSLLQLAVREAVILLLQPSPEVAAKFCTDSREFFGRLQQNRQGTGVAQVPRHLVSCSSSDLQCGGFQAKIDSEQWADATHARSVLFDYMAGANGNGTSPNVDNFLVYGEVGP